jgi:hypothetical protein
MGKQRDNSTTKNKSTARVAAAEHAKRGYVLIRDILKLRDLNSAERIIYDSLLDNGKHYNEFVNHVFK